MKMAAADGGCDVTAFYLHIRPKTSGPPTVSKGGASGFQRSLMSSSLPRLPQRYASPTTREVGSPAAGSGPGPAITAWAEEDPRDRTASPGKGESRRSSAHYSNSNTAPVIDLPGETAVSVGLMRIADRLARLALPWQAVLCPRAVETLYDVRKNIIQSRHSAFIESMKRKLEEKVLGFISKKEEEVEIWLENEIASWRTFMSREEADLTDFIKSDLTRISDRATAQDQAYTHRELAMATALDDHERDSTREQLVSFRRICRAHTAGSREGGEQAGLEVKLLQDSIAKAQSAIHKKIATTNRHTVK